MQTPMQSMDHRPHYRRFDAVMRLVLIVAAVLIGATVVQTVTAALTEAAGDPIAALTSDS